jgi:hypothetical protein
MRPVPQVSVHCCFLFTHVTALHTIQQSIRWGSDQVRKQKLAIEATESYRQDRRSLYISSTSEWKCSFLALLSTVMHMTSALISRLPQSSKYASFSRVKLTILLQLRICLARSEYSSGITPSATNSTSQLSVVCFEKHLAIVRAFREQQDLWKIKIL